MIREIARFFACILRLEWQNRDRRPLARCGGILATGQRRDDKPGKDHRRETVARNPEAVVDFLLSHARASVLAYVRGA